MSNQMNNNDLDELRTNYITQLIQKRKWDSQKTIIKSETIRFRQFLDLDNESGDRLKLELLASRLQFARQALAANESNTISSTSTSRKHYISRYFELTNHFQYNAVKALKRLRNLTSNRDAYRKQILTDCAQFLSDLDVVSRNKSVATVTESMNLPVAPQNMNTSQPHRMKSLDKQELNKMKLVSLAKCKELQTKTQESVNQHLYASYEEMESLSTVKPKLTSSPNSNSHGQYSFRHGSNRSDKMKRYNTQSTLMKETIPSSSSSSSTATDDHSNTASKIPVKSVIENEDTRRIQLYRENNAQMNLNFCQFEKDCVDCMNRCTQTTLDSLQRKISLINRHIDESRHHHDTSNFTTTNGILQRDIHEEGRDDNSGVTPSTELSKLLLPLRLQDSSSNHSSDNTFNLSGSTVLADNRQDSAVGTYLHQVLKDSMDVCLERDMAAIHDKFSTTSGSVLHDDDDSNSAINATSIDTSDE